MTNDQRGAAVAETASNSELGVSQPARGISERPQSAPLHSPAEQVAGLETSSNAGVTMPAPARSGGPTLTPALSAWLEEIREYLSSRQDVRDGSDGPRPNEEMTLLANLDEALRRPTFPNGNTSGPSAVEEILHLVVQEAIDNFARYYAEHHKLGMSIRSDMMYVAQLSLRWRG